MRSAVACENAHCKRCKCRCHGAGHGLARAKADNEKFFHELPEDDPHFVPYRRGQQMDLFK